jgi:hypothetical protein
VGDIQPSSQPPGQILHYDFYQPLIRANLLVPFLKEKFRDELILDPEFVSYLKPEYTQLTAQHPKYKIQIASRFGVNIDAPDWANSLTLTLSEAGSSIDALAYRLYREELISHWASQKFHSSLDSLYIKHRESLTTLVYTLLRNRSKSIVEECYCQCLNSEQTLNQLAAVYSEGDESFSYGAIGPVKVSQLTPEISQILLTQSIGSVSPPMHIDDWWTLIRVDRRDTQPLDDNAIDYIYSAETDSLVEQKIRDYLRSQPKLHSV